ncbi:MAG: DMT family transporter, partial [Alphaproteobacteria bacterium]|nr:DMT family transporter [Alphaproteobacteria bacterium]
LGLAALLGHERLGLAKGLGGLLTLLGVGLALGEAVLNPLTGPDAWIGVLAVLGSATTGAICSVLYRPYLRRYPILKISTVAMAAAVLALAPLALMEQQAAPLQGLELSGVLAVLFIGISSGVFYFLWLWALGHAPASRVAVFLSLSPPTAALLGILLLGEPVTLSLLAGIAAIVAGIVLAHR